MPAHARQNKPERRDINPRRFVIGGLAAPLAWALHLGIGYPLSGWVCAQDAHWLLYALTLAALLLAGGGMAAGRHAAGRVDAGRSNVSAARATLRFLDCGGWLLGLLFFVVILVQSIPIVLLERCV